MKLPAHHPYYYKFTERNGIAPFSKGRISKGNWMPRIPSLTPCRSGYHVLCPDGLIHWINEELYRVEVRGNCVWKENGKVLVVESYRTHSAVEQWSEKNCRLLACEFAQWAVDRFLDLDDDRPQRVINAARAYANAQISFKEMSAARSAAGLAAGSAAGSAAWSAAESAAWSAARSAAWSAARSAAGLAAESAARSAAESAARLAAWSAAGSAAGSAARSELNELLVKFMVNAE